MKKTLIIALLSILLFARCETEKDPFLITKGAIGNVVQGTQMQQLDSIFAIDSIVELNPVAGALGTQGEVEVYSPEGEKLLLISPEKENDPASTISNIQVFDNRYHTKKGLSLGSTYKDIKDNYTIASVVNTINSVVVFIKDSDVFVTIDKKLLPENLQHDPTIEIDASQIPDTAVFKYFMIGWDPVIEE